MSKSFEDNRSRRQLLVAILRYAVLVLMAVLGGFVAATDKDSAQRTDCAGGGFCDNCPAFQDCRLPRAVSQRRHPTETKDGRE